MGIFKWVNNLKTGVLSLPWEVPLGISKWVCRKFWDTKIWWSIVISQPSKWGYTPFSDSHWTNLIGKMMEHDDNRFNQWIGLFGKNCSETISFLASNVEKDPLQRLLVPWTFLYRRPKGRNAPAEDWLQKTTQTDERSVWGYVVMGFEPYFARPVSCIIMTIILRTVTYPLVN